MTPYATVALADKLSRSCADIKAQAANLGVAVERGDDMEPRLRLINRMAHDVLTNVSVLRIALNVPAPAQKESA